MSQLTTVNVFRLVPLESTIVGASYQTKCPIIYLFRSGHYSQTSEIEL